jgi:hypothetical protein
MFIYWVMGRSLPGSSEPSSRQSWEDFVHDLASNDGAEAVLSYGPMAEDVSLSRRSAFGDRAAVLTFSDEESARRASRSIFERLRINAADPRAQWSALGRLYAVTDSAHASSEHDLQAAPLSHSFVEAPGLYIVGWRPQEHARPALAEWYHEHLRWNSETYGAVDGIRCTAVDEPETPVTYPFDWLVLYWFSEPQAVSDMCTDLTQRYRQGWPDAARWAEVSFVDRSPFVVTRE